MAIVRHLRLIGFLAATFLVITAIRPVHAEDLTLKRVLLSSGGVGYFEYEALVTGDATLVLDVRLDQVDDVLKSIVVFDDQGGVGTIRLAGREPLAQIFRDLPFGSDALHSPRDLLTSLKGAEIAVTGARALRGRLLAVEQETTILPDGVGTAQRHRVSLLTADGVQQFVLEEQDSVQFTETALQNDIQGALTALADHRVQGRRNVTIMAPGEGTRRVRVGYVVEAPLWKASYRLSMEGAQGRLQGWAIVENMSGVDWQGVELTLASGNPVTFRQALYTAYFVHRPEVPVAVMGRILPPADTGTVSREPKAARPPSEPMVAHDAAPRAMMGVEADGMMMAESAKPLSMAQGALAVARDEATTQVLFRVAQPISVGSGQSLMVAVVDDLVPAAPVSLFQPATHDRHPLAAVRLSNASPTGLPPGVLTIYDARDAGVSFIGDARLAPMPAGEERLLSFALDQAVLVDREESSARTIVGGTLAKGALRLSVRQRATTLVRIKSSAGEPRNVIFEQPRRSGWELALPENPAIELTADHYRIPLTLQAGEETSFEIRLERIMRETVALTNLSDRDLEFYAGASSLDPSVRDTFRKLAALKADLARWRAEIERITLAGDRLFHDQNRLRENLGEVPRESDLHRRYLAKLAAQEDELDRLTVDEINARDAAETAERALADAIAALE